LTYVPGLFGPVRFFFSPPRVLSTVTPLSEYFHLLEYSPESSQSGLGALLTCVPGLFGLARAIFGLPRLYMTRVKLSPNPVATVGHFSESLQAN
jgi:hypothetical protein